ncbi:MULTISPECIES: hypothetical protein [Haloarcula]|uniref:hypothetical protein n=1 Tax=Haloarcula TaxID=2237 RepID=UPI0023E8552A|nr:hypothetical protein [Halomicroarcula sp. SHR3]
MGLTWKTLHGTKGRIVGTIFGLITLLFGVYAILVPNGVFPSLGGVLLAVVGLYELGKVALQSDYSIDITQG